jgi:hypothetical protein
MLLRSLLVSTHSTGIVRENATIRPEVVLSNSLRPPLVPEIKLARTAFYGGGQDVPVPSDVARQLLIVSELRRKTACSALAGS